MKKQNKVWLKIKSIFLSRIFIVGILLLLQLAFIFITTMYLSRYYQIIQIALFVITLLVILYLVNQNMNPAYKIMWILLVGLFPLFGGLLYLILGRNKASTSFYDATVGESNKSKEFLIQDPQIIDEIAEKSLDASKQVDFLVDFGKYPVYKNTKAKYFELGEIFFQELVEELKKAEKYIFLKFFIINEGIMWDTILSILRMKAAEGVEVRLIYDDVGCLFTLPSKFAEEMESYGIKCLKFNPLVPSLTLHMNNRDHQKIIVIDGNIGYTGGCNLADEYINSYEKYGHWKDNMIRLDGDAVFSLTTMFLETWRSQYETEEKISDYSAYKPSKDLDFSDEEGYYLPYGDNPFFGKDLGVSCYLNMINRAKKSIYIMTPYFIVDNETLQALCIAAKSGVDVRIITPHIPDKKIAFEMTRSFDEQLIDAGVRVYEYTPGFVHSKSIVVDGEIAVMGTINFDFRSFYLHFECAIWMYKTPIIAEMEDDFFSTLDKCSEVYSSKVKTVGRLKRFYRSILRVFAPLM